MAGTFGPWPVYSEVVRATLNGHWPQFRVVPVVLCYEVAAALFRHVRVGEGSRNPLPS